MANGTTPVPDLSDIWTAIKAQSPYLGGFGEAPLYLHVSGDPGEEVWYLDTPVEGAAIITAGDVGTLQTCDLAPDGKLMLDSNSNGYHLHYNNDTEGTRAEMWPVE